MNLICIAITKKGERCTRKAIKTFPWVLCKQHKDKYWRRLKLSTIFLSLVGLFIGFHDFVDAWSWYGAWFSSSQTEKVCSFDKKSSKFKVLILPFKELSKTSTRDIGLEIRKRLHDMDKKEDLNIELCYLDNINIGGNFTEDSAKFIQNKYKSDLIIYGNYADVQRNDIDEICYNWIVSDSWNLAQLQENTDYNIQYSTLVSFRNGSLQAKTDFIVYWVAGITAFQQRRDRQAADKFKYIFKNLNNVESGDLKKAAYFAAILSSSILGDFQSSLRYINEVNNTNFINSFSLSDSITFFTVAAETYNQANQIDTSLIYSNNALNLILSNNPIDTTLLLKTYLSLQAAYETSQQDSISISFGLKILELNKSGKYLENSELAPLHGNLALAYDAIGDSDNAVISFKNSIKLFEASNHIDSLQLAKTYKNFGNYFINYNSDSLTLIKGLEYTDKAYEIEQSMLSPNSKSIGHTLNQYAIIYEYLGNLEQAAYSGRTDPVIPICFDPLIPEV